MFGEITAKPLFGILVTIVTYILKVIGILSPLIASIGIFFGAVAAIYSWQSNRIKKKRELIELKAAELHLKQLEGK